MEALLWVLLPALVAAGSGLLAYYIMESRMEVALARERESTAEVRGLLEAQKQNMAETVRATEERAARQALDQFLADMRVEERSYVREHRALFLTRKSLVLQERMYFRNIPLSNWVEHEMPIEEGADLEKLALALKVFTPDALGEAQSPGGIRGLLTGR